MNLRGDDTVSSHRQGVGASARGVAGDEVADAETDADVEADVPADGEESAPE